MQVEQLALGVCHDHAAAEIRGGDALDHRVDERGRLTGARGADDQRMDAGLPVALKLTFLVEHRAGGNAVVFGLRKRLVGKSRKILISLLFRQEPAVLQAALDPVAIAAFAAEQALAPYAPKTAVDRIERGKNHAYAAAERPRLPLDQQPDAETHAGAADHAADVFQDKPKQRAHEQGG